MIDIDGPVFGALIVGIGIGWFVGFLSAVVAYMGMVARLNDAEGDQR